MSAVSLAAPAVAMTAIDPITFEVIRNKLAAIIGADYGPRTEIRLVDQVVVEHGTLPLDDLYFALKDRSINRGEVDYKALISGRPQTLVRNPAGRFRLFRIGDAVAARIGVACHGGTEQFVQVGVPVGDTPHRCRDDQRAQVRPVARFVRAEQIGHYSRT